MMPKVEIRKNEAWKVFLEAGLSIIFALAASYLVWIYEYEEGHFVYYFFKASFSFANYSKLILPLPFWFCFLIFIAFAKVLCGIPGDKTAVAGYARSALAFHLFLVISTRSGEIVDGFSLLPLRLDSLPGLAGYEKTIVRFALAAYYYFCADVLFRLIEGRAKLLEIYLPFSGILPFFYFESVWNFGASVLAGASLFALYKWGFPGGKSGECDGLFKKTRNQIAIIFFLGLGLRIWYAFYFESLGEKAYGFTADGFDYFNSGKSFAEGRWEDVNYWHAPGYSIYLGAILFLFGSSTGAEFYVQAIAGSFMPVVIFLIAKRIIGEKEAFLAGLLTASSHLCIHYSVAIHRVDPVLIALPLLLYLCLTYRDNPSSIKLLSSGFCMGLVFYCAQEALPWLLFFLGYLNLAARSSGFSGYQWTQLNLTTSLGFILAVLPLNLVYLTQFGKWILLGRSSGSDGHISSSWNVGGARSADILTEMGFKPLEDIHLAMETFLQNPMTVSRLLTEKFFFELRAFILDPGSIQIAPVHLDFDSFFGAHITFYFYLVIFSGTILFIASSRLSKMDKGLFLAPMASQVFGVTMLLHGSFRYRAPLTPLYLVFAAMAFRRLICGARASASLNSVGGGNVSFQISNRKKTSITVMAVILAFLLASAFVNRGQKTVSHMEISNWKALDFERKQMVSYNVATINSFMMAQYKISENIGEGKSRIEFDICRPLMPGAWPYYRLAVDGKFIMPARLLRPGCSRIREIFFPEFIEGVVTFYFYYSVDGETGEMSLVKFREENGAITIPVFNITQDVNAKEQTRLFREYSYGSVKVENPRIVPFS